MNKDKIFWYSVILALSLIGGAWWYSNPDVEERVSVNSVEVPPKTRQIPSGMLEYLSEQYKFSLLHSEKMKVNEREEGGGAMTVTFENLETLEGFQIFVLPYPETQVSEERFRQDVPSGVRKDPKSMSVSGAIGATFYSEDFILGETYEVWFIHGGFLYELTTFKKLDYMLNEVVKTIEFPKN